VTVGGISWRRRARRPDRRPASSGPYPSRCSQLHSFPRAKALLMVPAPASAALTHFTSLPSPRFGPRATARPLALTALARSLATPPTRAFPRRRLSPALSRVCPCTIVATSRVALHRLRAETRFQRCRRHRRIVCSRVQSRATNQEDSGTHDSDVLLGLRRTMGGRRVMSTLVPHERTTLPHDRGRGRTAARAVARDSSGAERGLAVTDRTNDREPTGLGPNTFGRPPRPIPVPLRFPVPRLRIGRAGLG
jgi:hypothetical protein